MSNTSTVSSKNINGIPCLFPNRTSAHSKDHYVSYNNYDRSLYYGHDTTAFVVNGSSTWFLILNGDHADALGSMDFDAALGYLHDHADLLSKRSDPLPPAGTSLDQLKAMRHPIMDELDKLNG